MLRKPLKALLISFVLILSISPLPNAGGQKIPSGVLFSESFDQFAISNRQDISPDKGNIRLRGGATFADDEDGNALKLSNYAWAEYEPPKSLNSKAGTLSLWVKPHWKEGENKSHTFLSFSWGDNRKGYFALSQGWWEPTGSGRIYSILNNQDFIHTSTQKSIVPEFWTMLTVTWQNGESAFCRLYIDGQMAVETQKLFLSSYSQDGPIFLGSDRGSTDQRQRRSDFFIKDFMAFGHALSDKEVSVLYATQNKNPVASDAKRWKWLSDGLNLPLETARTKDGVLIETRVIFDEDIRWATSKEETDRILARISRAGFNVYIPCVWHGAGTYFPSSLARPDARNLSRIESGDDPLAYLIDQAHKLGIEVHPWFTVVYRSTNEYTDFFDEGTPESAFNVHNSKFRNFIVDLMLETVRKYDVDGINLDYIRAMGICTSEKCREDYEQTSGKNFWADYALRGVLGESRSRLQKWQDEAVSRIVENFSQEAKKIKPGLVISVDGHPQTKDKARSLDGRDEVTWANKGWVDLVFAMDYRERIDFETIDKLRREIKSPNKLIVLFGNYEKRGKNIVARPGNLVSRYAEYNRRKWPGSGVAFYLYGRLSDEQIEALRRNGFSEPSIPKR
jgi:uncharacterized lipoprotein YddW (UPF0748 family)